MLWKLRRLTTSIALVNRFDDQTSQDSLVRERNENQHRQQTTRYNASHTWGRNGSMYEYPSKGNGGGVRMQELLVGAPPIENILFQCKIASTYLQTHSNRGPAHLFPWKSAVGTLGFSCAETTENPHQAILLIPPPNPPISSAIT